MKRARPEFHSEGESDDNDDDDFTDLNIFKVERLTTPSEFYDRLEQTKLLWETKYEPIIKDWQRVDELRFVEASINADGYAEDVYDIICWNDEHQESEAYARVRGSRLEIGLLALFLGCNHDMFVLPLREAEDFFHLRVALRKKYRAIHCLK
jgi:hypothetical protein